MTFVKFVKMVWHYRKQIGCGTQNQRYGIREIAKNARALL